MASLRRNALCGLSLFLAACVLSRVVQADPTRPFVLFDNGVRLSTNELSDVGKNYTLRGLIDDDPGTTWVFESLRTATPELRFQVPEGQEAGQLVLVEGCDESAALTRMRDSKATVRVVDARGAEVFRHELKRTTDRHNIALEGSAGGTVLVRLEETVPGERSSDTCISGLDLMSTGRSLLRTRGYIATDGGEYPDYALYVDGRKITDFPPDHVMETFFIESGKYAVFVHWQFPGVTVYNLSSGASQVVLEDVLVVWGTLSWRDDRFEGRQMNPPSEADTPFSRKVMLP